MTLRSIEQSAQLCRLLADETRLRLLLLLESHELTVAELTDITGLSQSRVSTHLGKLRDAGLVEARRRGAATRYLATATAGESDTHNAVWDALRGGIDIDDAARDLERAREVIRRRQGRGRWADSVAGEMELHYSPGRTWQATTHALLPLIDLGDVLDVAAGDGVLAALLAPRARRITCIDNSAAVVAAGRARLADAPNVDFVQSDMHNLPFGENCFDQVFLLHALSFTDTPGQVLAEIAARLRPGGRLIVATLAAHEHQASVAAYDHLNCGFEPGHLKALLETAGLRCESCGISSRETQSPYFELVTATACKPGA